MTDAQELQQTFDDTLATIEITTVGPGNPQRSPALGSTFPDPIKYWIIYNGCAVDIWVALDRNANAVPGSQVGYKIRPGFTFRLPVTTRNFISVDGGDGSVVDCHPFKWED